MGTRLVIFATLVLSSWTGTRAQSGIDRIRSDDSTIVSMIDQATERSPTFRGYVDTIGRSDGIVYILPGQCRYGGTACMLPNVTIAGPSRVLRILVNPRKAGCNHRLMATIGHELWHTIEVLREPSLRSYVDVNNFYSRIALLSTGERTYGAWETEAATKAGITIFKELRSAAPNESKACRRFL
jgi:hypothetical protein